MRSGVKALHLVLEYRACEVAVHSALPGGCSGRPPAVDYDNGKTLVGKPLRLSKSTLKLHDGREVRTAVRVEQHRQLARSGLPALREEHGNSRTVGVTG